MAKPPKPTSGAQSKSPAGSDAAIVKKLRPKLFVVIVVNFLICFYMTGVNVSILKVLEVPNSKILAFVLDAALSGAAGLVTTLLDGLLPVSIKNFLVFWRITNPLPSSQAFSKLMLEDDRVDRKTLARKVGKPTAPGKQTRVWFKLYNQHRNEPQILQFNEDFILMRDWCGFAFLFLLVGVGLCLSFVQPLSSAAIWGAIFVAQYLGTMIAARTYGKRLVIETLVVASNQRR